MAIKNKLYPDFDTETHWNDIREGQEFVLDEHGQSIWLKLQADLAIVNGITMSMSKTKYLTRSKESNIIE